MILRGKYGLIFTVRNMRLNTGCVMRNNGRISGVILLSAVVYQQAFWSHVLPICRKTCDEQKLLRVAKNFNLCLIAGIFRFG